MGVLLYVFFDFCFVVFLLVLLLFDEFCQVFVEVVYGGFLFGVYYSVFLFVIFYVFGGFGDVGEVFFEEWVLFFECFEFVEDFVWYFGFFVGCEVVE